MTVLFSLPSDAQIRFQQYYLIWKVSDSAGSNLSEPYQYLCLFPKNPYSTRGLCERFNIIPYQVWHPILSTTQGTCPCQHLVSQSELPAPYRSGYRRLNCHQSRYPPHRTVLFPNEVFSISTSVWRKNTSDTVLRWNISQPFFTITAPKGPPWLLLNPFLASSIASFINWFMMGILSSLLQNPILRFPGLFQLCQTRRR